MDITEKSTIRQLLDEVNNTGAKHPIFAEMRAKLGREDVVRSTVALVDWHEMAIVIIGEEPVGLLVVDWSEPCLEFKPLQP